MREHRKRIDRLQNLLIALVLINQTGMFRNLTGGSAGTPVEASFTGVQDTALSRQAPVALLIQTSSGRYGVQYDQDAVDGFFAQAGPLLGEVLSAAAAPEGIAEQRWIDLFDGKFLYFDYVGAMPLEVLGRWLKSGGTGPACLPCFSSSYCVL